LRRIITKLKEGVHGLHARPASQFVKTANKYSCEIKVIKEEVEVNGKSIMGLMMLALSSGVEFTIETSGKEEDEAIDALVKLIENDFQT
jgi:phosphocarrier protein